MHAKSILKFIIAIIASLAVLCIIFPDDGIDLFGTSLKFPSIAEVIDVTNDTIIDNEAPRAIIEKRKSDLEIVKENEFKFFCENNPTRFFMPGDDVSYLDEFFKLLDNAKNEHVRIMHYGDSQLECDRISCDLRSRFQEQFGGMGVGLIPVQQTIATYTLAQSIFPSEVSRGLIYGASENRVSHRRYGVMGQVTMTGGTTKVKVTGLGKKYPISSKFQRISVSARNGSFSVITADTICALKNVGTDKNSIYTITLPNSVGKATITLSGEAEVYGIMLDGVAGVSIDNIPMRGCSGAMFTDIDSISMSPFFKNENVGLIILQYGGNSVPYLKSDKSIETYKTSIKEQIQLFRQLSPSSKILFIGPADMATRLNGKMQTYPQMEKVVNALREAANEAGVAFWDMYLAMGGRNSIVQWVKARPQLAGPDHIHFTQKGAKEISDILYNTFQLYYKFYRYRNGLDEVSNSSM